MSNETKLSDHGLTSFQKVDRDGSPDSGLQGHTPGPWQAGHSAWPEQIGCCPLIGRPFSVHRTDNYENVAAATTKANARLIAAAPDLLEALEQFVASHGPGSTSKKRHAAFLSAKSAITRARGNHA